MFGKDNVRQATDGVCHFLQWMSRTWGLFCGFKNSGGSWDLHIELARNTWCWPALYALSNPIFHLFLLFHFKFRAIGPPKMLLQISETASHSLESIHASLSMEFSRQEYWSGLPFLLQRIFLNHGLNPGLLHRRQICYNLSHEVSLQSRVGSK